MERYETRLGPFNFKFLTYLSEGKGDRGVILNGYHPQVSLPPLTSVNQTVDGGTVRPTSPQGDNFRCRGRSVGEEVKEEREPQDH